MLDWTALLSGELSWRDVWMVAKRALSVVYTRRKMENFGTRKLLGDDKRTELKERKNAVKILLV